jgi:hypothetical protein
MIARLLIPSRLRIAGYVALGLLGWYTLSRIPAPGENPAVIAATEQALKAGKAYRAQRAADAKTISRLSREASEGMRVADSLRAAKQPLPEEVPDTCSPWAARLTTAEAESDVLRGVIVSKDSIIQVDSLRRHRAEARADTLDILLRKQPKPHRFLGVPYSVGVGVIVGTDLKPRPGVSVTIPLF